MNTLWRFGFYVTTIFGEKYFSRIFPIRFDRSPLETYKNAQKLISRIRKNLSIHTVTSSQPLSVVGNEKGKDAYVSGLKLTYVDTENKPQSIDLVIKYQPY